LSKRGDKQKQRVTLGSKRVQEQGEQYGLGRRGGLSKRTEERGDRHLIVLLVLCVDLGEDEAGDRRWMGREHRDVRVVKT